MTLTLRRLEPKFVSGAVASDRRERDEIKIVSNRIKSGTRLFGIFFVTPRSLSSTQGHHACLCRAEARS